jgi:type IX secretion system PorP/SprF family membrane protein
MKEKLLLLICLISTHVVLAQDPTFSQFYAAKIYYNPAYAGADNGVRASMNFREQWPSITSRFRTYNFNADIGIPKIGGGIGIIATKNVEGEGFLKTTTLGAAVSHIFRIQDNNKKKLYVHMGLYAAMINKAIEWDKLVYSDQLDPLYGKVTDISAMQRPPGNSRTFPDFGFGTMARYKVNRTIHTFGVSVSHLNEPDQSLLMRGQKLPMKYIGHYIGFIPVKSNKFYLSPGFIYERQSKLEALNVGLLGIYGPVFGGVWYRRKNVPVLSIRRDSFIWNVGVKGVFKTDYRWQIGYSYDLTVSGLAAYSGDTHEISLTIEYDSPKRRRYRKIKNCLFFKEERDLSLPTF